MKLQPEGVTVVVPVLPPGTSERMAIEVQRRALERVQAAHRGKPSIFWYYTPMALLFSAEADADLIVYDCMDELSAFRGAPVELRRLEQLLMTRADLVFTGGRSLFEAKRDKHRSVHAFPSSIDAKHFAAARKSTLADPADQAGIGRPRIGFFGVVDERMDIDLVGAVAAARPDWQFVFLGPVVKIDPADLPRAANIHWLGSKRYDDLPAYLGHWDVGFMPFAMNEATRYISPTKTPEFLAAGLPVVSTPIRDVVAPYGDRGLVEIAATAEEAVGALERMLAGPKADWRTRVDSVLSDMSWDKTWAEMSRIMATAGGFAADEDTETPALKTGVAISA
ncbi:glycosyltransferase [Chthonobacter albigriseus]|uniref:glycosyltransferase n=1 Tax=Chthonobacter albigriseus TaxID=1683161 RepID=UPI001FCEA245|nr:glycosyltransferase [Chthonobacter albigriseus]